MADERSPAVIRVMTQMEELDVRAILRKRPVEIAQNNPIKVSIWIFGLLLGAFANGFAVDEATAESYLSQLRHAEEVSIDADLAYEKAVQRHQWCVPGDAGHDLDIDGDTCVQAKLQLETASAHVDAVRRHDLMKEARKQVGIWSTFGVADVRKSFWSSWDAGKKWANKWTAFSTTVKSMNPRIVNGRPAKVIGRLLGRMLVDYVRHTTLGLVGAFGCFVYTLPDLVCSYGESFASGIAFVLLVVVAGMAFLGTYLVALYFTAGGSLVWGAKWVKRHRERRALRDRRDESESAPGLTENEHESAPELTEDECGNSVRQHLHEE